MRCLMHHIIVSPVLCVALMTSTGCRRATPSAVAAGSGPISVASGPASRPTLISFGGEKLGIAFDYPGTWTAHDSKDYELLINPPGDPPGRCISLDVPDLPFHIPGLIPIGSVQGGYVDDLKKQHGAVQITQLAAPSLGKCSVRMVRCTGHTGDNNWIDLAVLVVHADRVYVLRASTDTAGESETRSVFDAVIRSIRWVKR